MSSETIKLHLSNSQMTQEFGFHLANTLYEKPVTILLDGELGAGKTTLLQGLGKGLGITQNLSSPTYALEQRYQLPNGEEFLHLDLYRLTEEQAASLVAGSDGIRCIEWSDRTTVPWSGPLIRIRLREEGDGRNCSVTFEDIALPPEEEIAQWRNDVLLPQNIIDHCEAVARMCDELSANLLSRGIAIRPLALHRAAQVHDLLRFIDFKPGSGPASANATDEQRALWETWRARSAPTHEEACTDFLVEKGYEAIARMVRTHGVNVEPSARTHIEQEILSYADKRVIGDRVATVAERFEDFKQRYAQGQSSPRSEKWLREALDVERKWFGNQ